MTEEEKKTAIDKMIDRLRGTALDLDSECENAGLDPSDLDVANAVDQSIFACTICSWWHDMHEECSEFVGHPEWICSECARDQYEWDGEE